MITFIRHNCLQKPFNDYNNLNYKDLVNLSNQTVSPDISTTLYNSNYLKKIYKSRFDKIYTSIQKRTILTANILGYNEVKSTDLLNEIYFDVNSLITESEYKQYGLTIIRERLWNSIFLGKNGVEGLNNIIKRIDIFIEKCKKDKGKNILAVTHGFLLVLIRLRLNGYNLDDLKNYNILNLSSIDYLDGFEYNKI